MNIYIYIAFWKFQGSCIRRESSNLFGSLVVFLPLKHSGGDLVTRHNGEEVKFEWSLMSHDPVQKFGWAAFYSHVEHEMLPVTEGYQVTLTYNLYYCQSQGMELNVTTSPFFKLLKDALDHPHFIRKGGILGFVCKHSYVFQELN